MLCPGSLLRSRSRSRSVEWSLSLGLGFFMNWTGFEGVCESGKGWVDEWMNGYLIGGEGMGIA